MSNVDSCDRLPIILGFTAYGLGHTALFALIGLLDRPMPGLWWALLSIPLAILLHDYLRHIGCQRLASYVAIYAIGFVGGAVGAHVRELFCLAAALI